MLWHIQIDPAAGLTDTEARRITSEATDLGLPGPWRIASSRGFLIEGELTRDRLHHAAESLLVDPVVETFAIHECGHQAALDRKAATLVSGTVVSIKDSAALVRVGDRDAVLPDAERMPGEVFLPGQKLDAVIIGHRKAATEEELILSRTHSDLLVGLLERDVPEIADGRIEIRAIARDAGLRSKVALFSHDASLDPLGACIGPDRRLIKGIFNELWGEQIDLLLWNESPERFIRAALMVRPTEEIKLDPARAQATVQVSREHAELAAGSRDQNVRLAARLTGWNIEIRVGESLVAEARNEEFSHAAQVVHVVLRPGVTDPVAESARAILRDLGLKVENVRTVRTYRIEGPRDALPALIKRVLANDAVEQAVIGSLPFDHLGQGHAYKFQKVVVPLLGMNDDALMRLSREGQLALSLAEMKAIRGHFADLGRDPTDCELEAIAQTWSEHCSHKTLRGRIEFNGQVIDNLLKQTIFKATHDLKLDWLVSVFADNAGVIRFDDEHDVCFKVETHNHPSAIDPYGGANTGIGGVIRDPLGTGLGAKPICNTDVFCVAPPDTGPETLPPGVLHPRRVLKGVVAGVRDYGNRMGIPTVNGALVVDPRYLANPLVFCGTVGVLPRGMTDKHVEPGDRIVAIGGRTGRDGIHGATFSSIELSSQSEDLSGGAVQIGNAITEKMVLDVVLQARDLHLFRSITDCGAGGFSSAVGEMAASLGAEVDLERAPLKYEGLSYTEIWISEAQERMVLAVPPEHWPALKALCDREMVEATDLGQFVESGRLTLRYEGHEVANLSMDFLHHGRPPVVRKATYTTTDPAPVEITVCSDYNNDLIAILKAWDVCSKEWIVRQYDHEVQGRTILKPLVGVNDDGPGDAAVVLPVRGSKRGLAVACGVNPRYGEIDPYAMAASAVDEAVRNCVAVGADPDRIALLDNFCWGNTDRPETLGSLVLAAQACHDVAVAYRAPFISGKDSLNNEYTHDGQSLAIPGTLLISALGQVPDVSRCVTMDLKEPGNLLFVVGLTRLELGGSHWLMVRGQQGGRAPRVDPELAFAVFHALHEAITRGLVRSCHDLSEGGLAVALAEMALAGGLGARVSLRDVPHSPDASSDAALLFSESPSRFLLEIRPDHVSDVEGLFGGLPLGRLGEVAQTGNHPADVPRLTVLGLDAVPVIDASVTDLKAAWQGPLDW